jgi:ABC-type nitrate/sulfonate/bicarbonate transport system substrate-binding protein
MKLGLIRPVRLLSVLAVLLLVLAACDTDDADDADDTDPADEFLDDDDDDEAEPDDAADDDDAAAEDRSEYALDEPTEVNVGAIPGSQSFAMMVMMDQGIADDYNLDIQLEEFLNPPGLHVAIAEQAVDIGFGGITAMMNAREEGRETVIINMLSSPNNLILTLEDSDIEDLGDLQGARFGSFSGPGDTTLQIVNALTQERHDFNVNEETDFTEAANPALAGLMRQGELDAVLFGGTDSFVVYLEGDTRIVSDLSEDWEEEFGSLPAHVAVASYEGYVDENEEVIVAFNAALADAMDYMDENPQVWEDYAEAVELDDPDAPELLEERLAPRFVREWDEDQLEAQEDLLERVIEIAPPGTLPDEIPEGLFILDLQPGEYDG